MGWDVYIALNFDRKHTPLACLSNAHRKISPFFMIKLLGKDYLGSPIKQVAAPESEVMDISVFEKLMQETQNSEYAAEGWQTVPRFRLDAEGQAESFAYRSILHCLTPKYRWPGISEHAFDAVYDAGDYKHYITSLRGVAAVQNVQFLIAESKTLLTLDVTDMRGLGSEPAADPGESWLVYHRKAESYAKELDTMNLTCTVPLDDRIMEAALTCEDVTFEETKAGPIIYAKRGVAGRLRSFYETLAHR